MVKSAVSPGFWAGLIVGVVAVAAFSVSYALPRAMAQARNQEVTTARPRGPAANRYQVSAWSYPSGTGFGALHGAYILDTQDGKVWLVVSDQKPRPIGTVEGR
jgi:hypothetical protein